MYCAEPWKNKTLYFLDAYSFLLAYNIECGNGQARRLGNFLQSTKCYEK